MPKKYPSGLHAARGSQNKGVALVIVLAFVVLLTGVIIAFFSRSMGTRQISNSSASQTKADLFAQGASDTIIANLQQEIALKSTLTITTGSAVVYPPNSPASMLPEISGTTASLPGIAPNLLIRSAYDYSANKPVVFCSGSTAALSVPGGTVNVSSTTPSLNGRYVSLARWNSHYLLPLLNNSTDATPVTSGSMAFTAPDWVLVARDGTNPVAPSLTGTSQYVTTGSNAILGRYAYAVYHEGGLLDANVAGYPIGSGSAAVVSSAAYKPALAYADLTQIGLSGSASDALVAWRNWATAQVPGSSFTNPTFGAASGSAYFNSIIGNQTGFLRVSGTTLNPSSNGQSDRLFGTRQELIRFLNRGLGVSGTALNCLNYLGTFSRDLNQPSYVRAQSTNPSKTLDYDANAPKVLAASAGGNTAVGKDDQVNPSYLGVRVKTPFSRADGSLANAGEPLVKKRFALNRLAWLTYKGPSGGDSTIGLPPRSQSDSDIQALINSGISWSYLQQGTGSNIKKYFGLEWDKTQSRWKYDLHNGATGGGPAGPIMLLQDVANLSTPHEPDFFELLKATINVGSLGKALVPSKSSMPTDLGMLDAQEHPNNYNYYVESSVDIQIMQIGANIISQFQTANYPPRIVFDDGGGQVYMPRTIVGVSNLPYLSSVVTGIVQVQEPKDAVGKIFFPRNGKSKGYNGTPGSGAAHDSGYQTGDAISTPGIGAVMQFPVVWNPHDPASSAGAANAGPTQFRVVADSGTPDKAETGSGQYPLFTYGASDGNGPLAYSYGASATSPDSGWYRDPSGTGISIAKPLKADDSAVEFTRQSGTSPLFPEPAMLITPGTITDSGSNTVTVAAGGSSWMKTRAPVSALFSNGGLPSFKGDGEGLRKYSPYVGIYLGAFPLAWKVSDVPAQAVPPPPPPLSVAQTGAYVARYTGAVGPPAGSYQGVYLTYRVQYRDPTDPTGKGWITYDTKYGKTLNDCTTFKINQESASCGAGTVNTANSTQGGSGGFWAFTVDPRSSRFGLLWEGTYALNGDFRGMNSPYSDFPGYRTYKPLPCYTDTGPNSGT